MRSDHVSGIVTIALVVAFVAAGAAMLIDYAEGHETNADQVYEHYRLNNTIYVPSVGTSFENIQLQHLSVSRHSPVDDARVQTQLQSAIAKLAWHLTRNIERDNTSYQLNRLPLYTSMITAEHAEVKTEYDMYMGPQHRHTSRGAAPFVIQPGAYTVHTDTAPFEFRLPHNTTLVVRDDSSTPVVNMSTGASPQSVSVSFPHNGVYAWTLSTPGGAWAPTGSINYTGAVAEETDPEPPDYASLYNRTTQVRIPTSVVTLVTASNLTAGVPVHALPPSGYIAFAAPSGGPSYDIEVWGPSYADTPLTMTLAPTANFTVRAGTNHAVDLPGEGYYHWSANGTLAEGRVSYFG